jgi:2-C-methyl-D-erythritol 2,4-cyclodiphosphate synthase/2-C-methyl-D-erythritol 4-phosphate cytidylyltransferase
MKTVMENKTNKKAAAIIAAGGTGSRFDSGRNTDKLFALINNIPVIMHSVLAFERAESIGEIIIAAKSQDRIMQLCAEYGVSKLKAVVGGGADRRESVLNAVKQVSADTEIIAVHDGARPYITTDLISRIVGLTREKGAVIPAVRVKDTIKIVNGDEIISTPDRSGLCAAQTPQVFLLRNYLEAVRINEQDGGSPVTDDAMLMEAAGFPVYVTEGDYKNIKITTADDLPCNSQLRIGSGYDVHKFAKERKLILCGAEVPYEEGLLGHSDADVAVHALMDALLGALALGDIGAHFPDSEPQYKGISSMELLGQVITLINGKGFTPSNIDITIIADRPKLAPYIQEMRRNIAETCKVTLGSVSVKATTEEGLGLAGKGIGASAVCMVGSTAVT